MNTYYDLLGVSVDADVATIEKAYNKIINNAYLDLSNNRISKDDYDKICRVCTDAKNTLCNSITRAVYDQKCGLRSSNPLNNTGATVVGGSGQPSHGDDYFDDDYEDEEFNNSPKKRNWLKIALASGAIVAVIGLCTWIVPKAYNAISLKSDSKNIVGVVDPNATPTPGDGIYIEGSESGSEIPLEDEDPSATQGDPVDPNEQVAQEQGQGQGQGQEQGQGQTPAPVIKNYGDIKDAALVTERATKLLAELNKAGMTNLTTGIPYTQEEIETLILYVNGEYAPASEEEATNLYTEFLNFICAPINIDHTLIQSAYLGGEDSFKGDVEGFIKDQQRPDVVSAFIYGDSYAAPYLYWLQTKYYDMRYTVDREEATKIFNEVFQSYADIMKGDGFTLDGVTYKETNILGLDKVAVSNMYLYFGLNAEVFRTTATKDNYEVTNHLISADPNMQKDIASFDEIGKWLNGACDSSLIALDDQGLPLITGDQEGRTLGELAQINTIYRAKENYLDKNAKTLSK